MESTGHLVGVEEKHACGPLLSGYHEEGLCPPQSGALPAGVNIHCHHLGISLVRNK